MLDLLLPDEGETGFGAGDDDAAEMESFHHVASCLFDGRVFIADGIGENGVDLLEVRRDVVSAGVLHPVRPFRIHDDRHVVCLTGSDDFLAAFFGACPFTVVGNDETVQPLIQLLVDTGKEMLCLFSRHSGGLFKVETQHLLMTADHAQLRRGRTIGRNKAGSVDPSGAQFFKQALSVIVLSHKACNADLTGKARQIVRHVCCASQRFHFRSHVRDRNGGFRGNACHFAVVVFIEHHVTCDKDPTLGCARGDKAIKFLLIHKFLKFHHITELPLE